MSANDAHHITVSAKDLPEVAEMLAAAVTTRAATERALREIGRIHGHVKGSCACCGVVWPCATRVLVSDALFAGAGQS